MKQITKFEAKDGSIFNTKSACLDYENVLRKVDEIMLPLGKLPKDDGCRFANGGGYIQHEYKEVEKAKNEILELGIKHLDIKDKVSFGWIGRYFDDGGHRCLYSAWGRLSNIDNQNREWGQGYYAINPTKGVQSPFIESKP